MGTINDEADFRAACILGSGKVTMLEIIMSTSVSLENLTFQCPLIGINLKCMWFALCVSVSPLLKVQEGKHMQRVL